MGVIADDLTGCGDTGVQFADLGLKVFITVDVDSAGEVPRETEVWIINTNSRNIPEARAARLVRKAASLLKDWKAEYFYKKIDSTLRGNVGAELEALIEELELETLPLCAAFPAMGRTTVDKSQYVWGEKIEDTSYMDGIKTPGAGSSLRELLKAQMKNPEKVDILDASTDADLSRLAGEQSVRCFAGAAAFSGKLAETWIPSARSAAPLVFQPGPVLVISGSMNPVSRAQAGRWKESGKKLLTTLDKLKDFSPAGDLLLTTPSDETASPLKKLSRKGLELFRDGGYDRVILCGGDTAYGFIKALGADTLEVIKSIESGISLTASGGVFFILKPGGYGEPETINELARVLGGR